MRTASADVEIVSAWVRRVEDSEAKRQGRSVPDVRPALAYRVRTTPSVLRHLRERRRKFVPAWLMTAIYGVMIEVLQAEMRKLAHEIQTARQIGVHNDEDVLRQAEAQLASTKALLESAASGG